MEKNKKDIYDRIYKFVLKVLQVLKLISKTPENLVLIKQAVRSAGSIGANASEQMVRKVKGDLFINSQFRKRKQKKPIIGFF